jgi:hypothetical protein
MLWAINYLGTVGKVAAIGQAPPSDVSSEVLTLYEWRFKAAETQSAVNKKDAVFWDVMQCTFCKSRRFRGRYRLHHQGRKKY